MSSRREFISRTTLISTGAISSPTLGFAIVDKTRNPDDDLIGHGKFRYKMDRSWAKISVNTNPLFNCHEMVQDSKGRLIMLGDHTSNNILIFDKSGKLLDHWGTAFPGGHGLTLAKEGGEDFLMITDCGWFQDRTGKWDRQSGQVLKMSTSGKLIFAIGHPKTIGIYKEDMYFQPTETAIAPNGDIYVADGYGSDHIIQYNSKGQYIRHFGGRDNAEKEHNLYNAHGITVDLRDKNEPVLICSSREENCFKIFSMDGKFRKRIDMPGMYVCRAVMDGDHIYAGVCWSKDNKGERFDNSGFVTILDKNNMVISNPGGTAPTYKNGVLQQSFQQPNPVFNHGHDVCVDDEQNLYVCQWNANHTAPIKLTRAS